MAAISPDILYHYCGVNGFHGILKQRALWLSDATMLNDYLETECFLSKARAFFNDASRRSILKRLDVIMKSIIPYITCFSTKPIC